jgi:uncharacterized protein YcfJ
MWIKTVSAATVLGTAFAGPALADHGRYGAGYGGTQYVYARVVDVDPIVRYVTVERPHQECWNDVVRESRNPYGVAGTTVAGGIVGAAIGRQFGSGDSRDVLTMLGATVGAAVANQRAQRNQGTRDVAVERCEVVGERTTEQRIDGYDVTYVYDGRHYTMRTDSPPGDRIRIAVDVRPVVDRGHGQWNRY